VPTEIDKIEDVFLEAAPAKAGAGFEELASDAAVGTDGMGYLLHIGSGGFTEGCDRIDRADALGQEGIGGELGELRAPEVGAQDPLLGHPMAVHTGQGLNRGRIFTADQDPIRRFEIGNCGALSQKFRIGEHREGFGRPRTGHLSLGGSQNRLHGFGGAHRQGALLHYNRVALRTCGDLAGRGFYPAQVTRLAGANTLGFGGGVHRKEHHVSRGDRRLDSRCEVQIAPAATTHHHIQPRLIDRQLGQIRIVPGIDARLVEIHHRDLNVGATIGDHSHGGTAHIARSDAADGADHEVMRDDNSDR